MTSFSFFSVAKFFLLFSLFTVVVVFSPALYPFVVPKYVFFRFMVFVASMLCVLGFMFDTQRKDFYLRRITSLVQRPFVITLFISVIVSLIADALSFNPGLSFWSNFQRGDGGFALLTLFLFFFLLCLLFVDVRDWRLGFWVSFVAGLGVVGYGILAHFHIPGIIYFPWDGFGYRFQGSVGSSAYAAGYLLFVFGYVLYLSLSLQKPFFSLLRLFLIFSFILFFLAFAVTGTRGAFVGLVVACIATCMYLFLHYPSLRTFFLIFFVLFAFLLVGAFLLHKQGIQFPGGRLFDLSITTHSLQHRFFMWGIAWQAALQYPFFGWGHEGASFAYYAHYDPAEFSFGGGGILDRFHNIFIDKLISSGFLGLLSYIAVFVIFFTQWLRFSRTRRLPLVSAFFLFVIIAYLVQGLMVFDSLVVSLQLYFVFAFGVFVFDYA